MNGSSIDLDQAAPTEIIKVIERCLAAFPFSNYVVDRTCEQAISHVYSVPNVDYNQLKIIFSIFNIKLIYIESSRIKGVFANFPPFSILFYQPHAQNRGLSENFFNQSIDAQIADEVVEFGVANNIQKLANIDFETFKALLVTHTHAISCIHGLEVSTVEQMKSYNTFRHLKNTFLSLSSGQNVYEDSHIASLARIYYVEMRVISEIFGSLRPISLHDVATNTAQLPILLNAIDVGTLFGSRFESIQCSDIEPSVARSYINFVSDAGESQLKSIELSTLDLLDPGEVIIDADVITANDILEHFDEYTGKKVFQNLWKLTKKLLIIHVPFESIANKQYGHFNTFYTEKLREWTNELDDCNNLTDSYKTAFKYERYISEIYNEFLFLMKNP